MKRLKYKIGDKVRINDSSSILYKRKGYIFYIDPDDTTYLPYYVKIGMLSLWMAENDLQKINLINGQLAFDFLEE